MNIVELKDKITKLNNAYRLPQYINVSDISLSQIMITDRWENIPYSWGICKKNNKFIFFETDEERGYICDIEEFEDEDSACKYALNVLSIINDSLSYSSSELGIF